MGRQHGRQRSAFGDRSLFDGIRRREVGRRDLVVHCVGVLTPSLSALGTGLALPAIVGPGFWLSVLLGFALAWCQAATFDEFASRFGSAGSLYTFVAKGLGGSVAMVVAVALVLGYGSFVAFGLTAAAHRVELTVNAGGGGAMGQLADMTLVVLFAGFCLVMLRRGVVHSTRLVLAVEVVSVMLLVAALLAIVTRFGPPSADTFSLAGASGGRILVGAALVATLTVAFESSATLGLEARQPLRTVPSSMRRGLVLTGGLVLVASVVGASRPTDLAWSWRWFGALGQPSFVDSLILAALALSLVTLALCAWTALSRLVFSFAREGLLWRGLGRTDRHGVPLRAAVVCAPLVVGLPLGAWAMGVHVPAAAGELLHSATTVMCLAYALTAVAVVPFLRSIDELRPRSVALAVVTALGSAAVAARQLTSEELGAARIVAVLTVVAAGLLWRAALVVISQPTVVPGAHDEPVRSDAVLPR